MSNPLGFKNFLRYLWCETATLVLLIVALVPLFMLLHFGWPFVAGVATTVWVLLYKQARREFEEDWQHCYDYLKYTNRSGYVAPEWYVPYPESK